MSVSYTFSPPYQPDFGMQRAFKPRVLMAQFGDGYAQRTADGINNDAVTLTPKWTNLSATDKDAIVNFFKARGGYQSFYFTYADESSPKVYLCTDFNYNHDDAGAYSVTATFVQVFDI